MWEALIGAGASLVGSLFGGGSKSQETTNYVDYKRMVRDAEAAGFNPLTALRNGGAAGFSVSSTPATPLSARIADGVAGATQSFLQNFDPFADQKREAEFSMIQAQVANLNADTALKHRTGLGSVPSYTAGNMKRTMGAGIKHGQTFKSVTDAVNPKLGTLPAETKTPDRTNPYPSWLNAEVNPWMPDISAWEDHFGDSEISSTLGAVLQKGQDLVWNGYRFGRSIKNDFIKPALRSKRKSLYDDHIPDGFNIYGEPPALTSRRYKNLQ